MTGILIVLGIFVAYCFIVGGILRFFRNVHNHDELIDRLREEKFRFRHMNSKTKL